MSKLGIRAFAALAMAAAIVAAGTTSFGEPSKAKHVILISIDGLSPRLIREINPPWINALKKQGSYTYSAQTTIPPWTLPSHASMISGVAPNKHGMSWNTWEPDKPAIAVETIFSVARHNNLSCALIASKEKFLHLGHDEDRVIIHETSAKQLGARVVDFIAKENPALLMVHFSDVDLAGHHHGWYSELQKKALSDVDDAIGLIVQSLRDTRWESTTTIIITADHGGHGLGHGADIPEDMTIPWIISGPGINKNAELRQITTYDTAPTVLYMLGLAAPQGWDGKLVREVFN